MAGYVSALLHLVNRVVPRRPKKQMVGIDTRGIVALVTDVLTRSNRSMKKLVGHAMRPQGFPTDVDCPISLPHNAATCPNPATVCLLHLQHEPLHQCFHAYHLSQIIRTNPGKCKRNQLVIVIVTDRVLLVAKLMYVAVFTRLNIVPPPPVADEL